MKLFEYTTGKTYHITVGNIGNVVFMAIDEVLALEVRDPDPIDINKHGLIGFEAFCTRVKYKNLRIRKLEAEEDFSLYESEF